MVPKVRRILDLHNLLMLVYIRKYNLSKMNKIISALAVLLIAVNVSMYGYINLKEIESFHEITNDIKEMRNTKNLKLKLTGSPDLYGYLYTLNDNGVKYTIKNNIAAENMRYKYKWRIGVEIDEEVH